jgi:carboxypeptidase Q
MIRRMPFPAVAAALLFFAALAALSAPGNKEPASPDEDGTLKALTAIAGKGMMNSHAFDFLAQLSDDIGGRVTGSPQAAKAIQWGVGRMKFIGLENVHTETWNISRGWTRGSAEASLVTPVNRRLMVDAMGWVGSTPAGGVESDLMPVNLYRLKDAMQQDAGKWAGKILIMVPKGEAPENRADMFAQFGPFLKAAWAAHAVAIIGGQGGSKAIGMHLTHTGALGFDTYFDIPVLSMAAEDQELLERFLDRSLPVRLKINVQNHFTDGPVESANVVGEIRGTDHPEQVVVVGGHLDSWDLADGATDDGVGVATTLGAAEAIVSSGFKPRRTIRFVLFTGEEEGLLGSLAYAKSHQQEMANHVAAVVLDNGQGPVDSLELGGRDDLVPAVKKFAESVRAFGEVEVNDKTSFGTDCGPFILAGLPGINMGQDSPDYKYTHHSSVDTLDKVRTDVLTRDATLMALTSFWIADRPERLAVPWPAEKSARMLIEKKQDGFLKAFDLWPFGSLGHEPEKKKP